VANLIVWPIDGIRRILFGTVRWKTAGVPTVLRHLMTSGARDAIARQRAVLTIRFVRQGVNHLVLEWLMSIEIYLPLAHHHHGSDSTCVRKIPGVQIEMFFLIRVAHEIGRGPARPISSTRAIRVRREVNRFFFGSAKKSRFLAITMTTQALARVEIPLGPPASDYVIVCFAGKALDLITCKRSAVRDTFTIQINLTRRGQTSPPD